MGNQIILRNKSSENPKVWFNNFETVIENADLATLSKRNYKNELSKALSSGVDLLSVHSINDYLSNKSNSAKQQLGAAIRKLFSIYINELNTRATPENINSINAISLRLTSIGNAITSHKKVRTKPHTWLSEDEVLELMGKMDLSKNSGKRDYVLFGIALSCGLRVSELSNLKIRDFIKMGDRYAIFVRNGKGGKSREVFVNWKFSTSVLKWVELLKSNGFSEDDSLVCSVYKSDKIRKHTMGSASISRRVKMYSKLLGQKFACHDLRRTFAMNAYSKGTPIGQISNALGHKSIQTTQLYLNLEMDAKNAPSDNIKLGDGF